MPPKYIVSNASRGSCRHDLVNKFYVEKYFQYYSCTITHTYTTMSILFTRFQVFLLLFLAF